MQNTRSTTPPLNRGDPSLRRQPCRGCHSTSRHRSPAIPVLAQLFVSYACISVWRERGSKPYHRQWWNGLPLVFILTWAYLMEQELRSACWEGYGANRYVWLLIGPRLVAILVNFVFLVNIIRILVTRVKSAVSVETTQFRKAIKATVLLFPLLGITHLLFCINPQDENMGLKEAYMVINAILQSSQGIFVSVLYCFMNSEVQTAVRNAYLRAAIRRNPNKERSFLRGGYSQTSTVFMSHFNGSVVEQSASPKAGSKVVRKYPLRATAGPQRISRNPGAVAAV